MNSIFNRFSFLYGSVIDYIFLGLNIIFEIIYLIILTYDDNY